MPYGVKFRHPSIILPWWFLSYSLALLQLDLFMVPKISLLCSCLLPCIISPPPNASSLWIPISFLMQFTTWSKKPPPPPQPAMIHHPALNTLRIPLVWHWTQTALNIFSFFLFMSMLLLLWKEHRVHQQTDVDLNFRSVLYWPWDPVPVSYFPEPSAFFPVMWKWLHLPLKMLWEVKTRYSAWCMIEDYSHNYWFPSTWNSTWHIIGSSKTICWMNGY